MKPFADFTKYLLAFLCCFSLLIGISSYAISKEAYVFERMWPTLQQPWYFYMPVDFVIDSDDNIYVANHGNDRIMELTQSGEFITKWLKEVSPTLIAIDQYDNIYVTEGANWIHKFSSEGDFIAKWGGTGSENGQFLNPTGIAIDINGDVYVSDRDNHRIQKFSSDGTFITKWGEQGNGEGQFNHPIGIAIDESNRIYVADMDNHRIQVFNSDGEFLYKWGMFGEGDGDFSCPYGIAIDHEGNIYVTEGGPYRPDDVLPNQRVQKFTPDGQFITKWGGLFFPQGIIISKSGTVFVADTYMWRVKLFDLEGRSLGQWSASGSGDGEFTFPGSVVTDADGNVFVTDQAHLIQKFSPEGQLLAVIGDPGWVVVGGIDIDKDGNIFVCANYQIWKLDPEGTPLTFWGGLESEYGSIGGPIVVDFDGNVYAIDNMDGSNRILKFRPVENEPGVYDYILDTQWGSKGSEPGQFDDPKGIAVDTDGNVYVAESENNRVQKFSSEGVFLAEIGAGSGFSYVWGVTLDTQDYIYVSDWNGHIYKFSPEGQLITVWGSVGDGPGQFHEPNDLAIGTDGFVYVTDTSNSRLQVFKKVIIPNSKAIIIAGGGPFPGNNLWDATQMCANYAYRALTYQGYTNDTIYYLSADTDLDLDGDGVVDVDGDATNSNLQSAISTWAQDVDDLFIYMVDHGGGGTFRMGATELLYAEELDSWLDEIQGTIPGTVTLLYDACQSGSFLPLLTPPEGKERVVATSASSYGEALFGSQGTISFSFLFWARMFNGESFYDSFVNAKNSISMTYLQTAQIEANGNGIANEYEDKVIAGDLKIGNETLSAGDIPYIGSVSPEQTLGSENSAVIYAEDVIDANGISRAWAVITPPGDSSGSPDIPITDLPTIDLLDPDGDNRYEGTYNGFSSYGTYHVTIYAMDRYGNISIPVDTYVYTEIGPDLYEDDDNLGNANIIIAQLGWEEMYETLTQRHNFHDEADEDWVKFYGITGEIYNIQTGNMAANCDTVIMLYDENGDPILGEPRDDYGYGQDESISWYCPSDGVYYVMVKQCNSTDYGQNTGYDLKLYHPKGGIPGWLTGIVVDSLGEGISNAVIKSDVSKITTISNDNGTYLMVLPSGTHAISVAAIGYETQTQSGVEVQAENYVNLDFFMSSTARGEYILNIGWNLMSLNKVPSDATISTVLDTITSKYISVWAYTDGNWQVYDPNNPGFSDLNNMDAGRGYWINMAEAGTLTISGSNPLNSIDLSTGWNLVGYNSESSQDIAVALASIEGKYISVWAYMDGGWKVYDPENPGFSDLLTMAPGYGYWINTKEACMWTVP
jgi:sugar lactone lactonase YvrE